MDYSCGQRYTQVRPRLATTLTHLTTLAQCTGASRIQAWPHGVQLFAQPSTLVPCRPLPVCLQCRLQTTLRSASRGLLVVPRHRLSSYGRRASSCGRPCDMKLFTSQSERSSHQQRFLQAFTENVFIFSILV